MVQISSSNRAFESIRVFLALLSSGRLSFASVAFQYCDLGSTEEAV